MTAPRAVPWLTPPPHGASAQGALSVWSPSPSMAHARALLHPGFGVPLGFGVPPGCLVILHSSCLPWPPAQTRSTASGHFQALPAPTPARLLQAGSFEPPPRVRTELALPLSWLLAGDRLSHLHTREWALGRMTTGLLRNPLARRPFSSLERAASGREGGPARRAGHAEGVCPRVQARLVPAPVLVCGKPEAIRAHRRDFSPRN